MGLCKSLQNVIESAKLEDSYWIEAAKIEFSLALEVKRKASKMSYADLARNLNTSKAYISKVFRGDANFTIESMVKLARAVGCNISIMAGENINLGIMNSHISVIEKERECFKFAMEASNSEAQSRSQEYYQYLSIEDFAATNDDKYLKAA